MPLSLVHHKSGDLRTTKHDQYINYLFDKGYEKEGDMNELLPSLSQEPWELLGGVTRGYFAHDQSESILRGTNEQIQLEKVTLEDVFGCLNEVQANDFEREVVMCIVDLHPLLPSISTVRCIEQEEVVGGVPKLYFQVEGSLQGEPGVATIEFNPNVNDKEDMVCFESDFGNPEKVGYHDDAIPVSLFHAFRLYSDTEKAALENMIVVAVLQRHPECNSGQLIKFEGSEAATGVFTGQTNEGERYVVMQHPALIMGRGSLVRAVMTFGTNELDLPVNVRYETKFIQAE